MDQQTTCGRTHALTRSSPNLLATLPPLCQLAARTTEAALETEIRSPTRCSRIICYACPSISANHQRVGLTLRQTANASTQGVRANLRPSAKWQWHACLLVLFSLPPYGHSSFSLDTGKSLRRFIARSASRLVAISHHVEQSSVVPYSFHVSTHVFMTLAPRSHSPSLASILD